eukprot:TRINITY_DN16341_c0_g2_i1.p1 TRINITY_DN16341_c0_g2~~TRINITY_DN16341_c0_g2_i1.p1  ORF type:complete len:281 (-),score=59.65 TRINITY_DN16341_c0_g2_i1:17-814(-)
MCIRDSNNIFPFFTVVFKTISSAWKAYLDYSVMFFLLLYGFVVFALIAFGERASEYRDLFVVFLNLFGFALGDARYAPLQKGNDNMGLPFYFIFFILFTTIILPFFVAVIINVYLDLRGHYQKTIQALVYLAQEKSKKVTRKWVNLIIMRRPPEEEEALNVEEISSSKSGPGLKSQMSSFGRRASVQKERKHIQPSSKLKVFLYNAEELLDEMGWFGLMPSKNMRTRLDLENEIRETIEKMEKEKRETEKTVSYTHLTLPTIYSV